MGYSPWSEREIWPNFKNSKIFETGEATAAKIGFYVFYFNRYLHDFFDLILFFDLHGPKGNYAHRFNCDIIRRHGIISYKVEAISLNWQ